MKDAQKRFWQTLRLVEKEGEYLQDVAGRLFVVPEIKAEWIERLIARRLAVSNANPSTQSPNAGVRTSPQPTKLTTSLQNHLTADSIFVRSRITWPLG